MGWERMDWMGGSLKEYSVMYTRRIYLIFLDGSDVNAGGSKYLTL